MDLDPWEGMLQIRMQVWIWLKRYAMLRQFLQIKRINAFGCSNVDRASPWIHKILQQLNFRLTKVRTFPRPPFHQQTVSTAGFQNPRYHPSDIESKTTHASNREN